MTKKKLRIQAGGQVVLMVLLASALVLTLGLSAARQATVETSIDTDQELLKKAFNAAESGIEYYIKTGEKSYGNADSGGNSTLTTKPLGNDRILSFNSKISPEEVEFFWLVNHTENGDIGGTFYNKSDSMIDICSDDRATAVNFKIDYFYKDIAGIYKVQRGSGGGEVVSTNGNALPNNCINDFLLQGNSVLLAVTPMGVASKISIKGGVNFPAQGEKISSTGSVGKVNNLVTIDKPYKLFTPFLLDPIVSEGIVTN